jgi:hypothetical protein
MAMAWPQKRLSSKLRPPGRGGQGRHTCAVSPPPHPQRSADSDLHQLARRAIAYASRWWWRWYWYRYVKEQRSVSHRRRMVASMQEKMASAPLGACVVAGAPAGQSKRRKGIGRCPEWPSQILTSPAAPCLSCTVGLQTSDDRHTARAGRFGSTPSPPSLSMGGERWRASCRSYVRVLGCY